MAINKRHKYDSLNKTDKELLLKDKLSHFTDFRFIRMETFSAFGQTTETGIFEYKDGCEFVVVPGDTVMLGWDASLNNMDGLTKQEFEEMLGPEGVDLNNYLTDSCTPVRKVTILVILQVACAATAFAHPSHLLM